MSVFKRFNGKRITSDDPNWSRGTWYVYKRIAGQPPIQKAIPEAKTKAQAEVAELKEIAKAFNKKYGEKPEVTFHTFADSTYRTYINQANVNKKAKLTDLEIFLKFFGKKKLITDIKVKDCRDLQYQLIHTPTVRDTERSPSTVNRQMATLSKIFSLAMEEELVDRNPMQFVKKLDEPPPRHRVLTDEQKERFWQVVARDKFTFRICMLAMNMPLRLGQILSMTRESVDLENRSVFVIGSKGRKARPVPLNAAALRILTEVCSEVPAGLLFTYRGKKMRTFRSRWKKALLDAGINQEGSSREDNFHFHDFRTMFATELLRNNVNPEIVRRLFAHSTMQITQVYMSADDDQLQKAVDQLDYPMFPTTDTVQ